MEGQLEIRRYFLVIRRWLWLIVGCAVLAGVSAYFVSSRMTPIYSAAATLRWPPIPDPFPVPTRGPGNTTTARPRSRSIG